MPLGTNTVIKENKNMNEKVMLAHGGGGEMTKRLLENNIFPKLSNNILNQLNDSALLPEMNGRVCFTTDSYVVQPLFFSGGNIGRIAVCGTVNDLSVMGAKPVALSLALIIEEGMAFSELEKIITSIADTAKEAGIPIVTGDTKVIERGRGDGLMINTAGVGEIDEAKMFNSTDMKDGDVILINGNIADHGLAVMSAREGLGIDTGLQSDVAPLNGLIGELVNTDINIRFMRDATRSGVAGVLCDIVEETGFSVEIEESSLPVSGTARHTAEMLGLDVLTVANEGKFIAVISAKDKEKALQICKQHKYGKDSTVIGKITKQEIPLVEMVTSIGGRRIVQRPFGEELPRIC